MGLRVRFFPSDQTYLEVMWTAPRKGNAWYIPAHQYIAAELKLLTGAAMRAVSIDDGLSAPSEEPAVNPGAS